MKHYLVILLILIILVTSGAIIKEHFRVKYMKQVFFNVEINNFIPKLKLVWVQVYGVDPNLITWMLQLKLLKMSYHTLWCSNNISQISRNVCVLKVSACKVKKKSYDAWTSMIKYIDGYNGNTKENIWGLDKSVRVQNKAIRTLEGCKRRRIRP